MNGPSLESCPHCGASQGYYTKMYVRGSVRTYFNADGSEGENWEMYDYLNHTGGKIAYCNACHKKVFEIGREQTPNER